MSTFVRLGCVVAAALIGVGALASAAGAQGNVTGPTVLPDRFEAAPGEVLVLEIAGFSAPSVTISLCGNEARRGSVDCDMRSSVARETPNGFRRTDFTLTEPPAACPCIIRVSSNDQREVAAAPIVLVGHPVAEVVGGGTAAVPLGVAMTANPAPAGFGETIRRSLGGSTTYDVTIRVTNRATFEVPGVAVAATFTRGWSDDTRNIDVPDPGTVPPGQTWEQTVQVDVPSLTFGDVDWRATVSGQGPSVTATDTSTSTPVLLIVLGIVLLVDVVLLTVRMLMRLRRRRSTSEPDDDPFLGDVGYPDDPDGDTSRPARVPEPQLVG